MTTVGLMIDIPGLDNFLTDVNIPDLINSTKEQSHGVFLKTVIDCFNAVDLKGIELEDWQKAALRPQFVKLMKLFRIDIEYISNDYAEWMLNTPVNWTLQDFDGKTIFNEYLKSHDKNNH